MALNTLNCNYLTQLHFKGLNRPSLGYKHSDSADTRARLCQQSINSLDEVSVSMSQIINNATKRKRYRLLTTLRI